MLHLSFLFLVISFENYGDYIQTDIFQGKSPYKTNVALHMFTRALVISEVFLKVLLFEGETKLFIFRRRKTTLGNFLITFISTTPSYCLTLQRNPAQWKYKTWTNRESNTLRLFTSLKLPARMLVKCGWTNLI